jgi:sugar (pentulose or hexulose) kinase
MTRTWLGIDAGTSVVKAALFDDEGEALAIAGRPLELVHAANDGVEQDLDAIVAAIAERNLAVAADAMRAHLQRVQALLLGRSAAGERSR